MQASYLGVKTSGPSPSSHGQERKPRPHHDHTLSSSAPLSLLCGSSPSDAVSPVRFCFVLCVVLWFTCSLYIYIYIHIYTYCVLACYITFVFRISCYNTRTSSTHTQTYTLKLYRTPIEISTKLISNLFWNEFGMNLVEIASRWGAVLRALFFCSTTSRDAISDALLGAVRQGRMGDGKMGWRESVEGGASGPALPSASPCWPPLPS